eukprot:TRINITY_DN20956_c0_g1_i1.p1 TRINITY_DN20956_c0_g1~~TRINITY_DN20956_c0_g1_i1.p1  ORF type:complete len:307 (+),score=53.96 TRINITY_DN20956_c0_g1_i1:89-922(+)
MVATEGFSSMRTGKELIVIEVPVLFPVYVGSWIKKEKRDAFIFAEVAARQSANLEIASSMRQAFDSIAAATDRIRLLEQALCLRVGQTTAELKNADELSSDTVDQYDGAIAAAPLEAAVLEGTLESSRPFAYDANVCLQRLEALTEWNEGVDSFKSEMGKRSDELNLLLKSHNASATACATHGGTGRVDAPPIGAGNLRSPPHASAAAKALPTHPSLDLVLPQESSRFPFSMCFAYSTCKPQCFNGTHFAGRVSDGASRLIVSGFRRAVTASCTPVC